MKTALALIVLLLLSGCFGRTAAIPDPRVPHRVATEFTAEIWVRGDDGRFVRQCVRVPEGWWIASDRIVDP